MKLRIIIVCLFIISICENKLSAQILNATIKVNGLTCSQCSRSVEMQLRKLSFVGSVDMDLQATEAKIYFKAKEQIDFYKLAKAVENGGFSVGNMIAQIDLSSVTNKSEQCFKIKDAAYILLSPLKNDTSSVIKIQFLGKSFGSKNNTKQAVENKEGSCKGKNTYWVTEL